MPIEFNCSECGKRLRVPDVHAGKRARCPDCQAINNVPHGLAGAEEAVESEGPQAKQAPLGSVHDASWPERYEHHAYQARKLQIELPNDLSTESKPNRIDTNSLPVSNPFAINEHIPGSGSYPGGHRSPERNFVNPHRGGVILTLGIVAVFCNMMLIPGLLAWIMGRHDLKEIRAGRMDHRGEALTQTGMILGIVFTLISIGFVALYLLVFAAALIG